MIQRIFEVSSFGDVSRRLLYRVTAEMHRIALDAACLSTGCRLVALGRPPFLGAPSKGRSVARALVILIIALCFVSRLQQSKQQNCLDSGRLGLLANDETRQSLVPMPNNFKLPRYPSKGVLPSRDDDATASMPSSQHGTSANGKTLLHVVGSTDAFVETLQTIVDWPHRFQGDGERRVPDSRSDQTTGRGMHLSWPGKGDVASRKHEEYHLLLGHKNEKKGPKQPAVRIHRKLEVCTTKSRRLISEIGRNVHRGLVGFRRGYIALVESDDFFL
jgi:hypothetical protein